VLDKILRLAANITNKYLRHVTMIVAKTKLLLGAQLTLCAKVASQQMLQCSQPVLPIAEPEKGRS
jgi:hypothetical protein